MAETVYIGRVFAVMLLDGGGIAPAVLEIPLLDDVDALAAGLDGAFGAEQVEGLLQIVGIDIGGAFDEAL